MVSTCITPLAEDLKSSHVECPPSTPQWLDSASDVVLLEVLKVCETMLPIDTSRGSPPTPVEVCANGPTPAEERAASRCSSLSDEREPGCGPSSSAAGRLPATRAGFFITNTR